MFLYCDNAVINVYLDSDTNNTWLASGNDHIWVKVITLARSYANIELPSTHDPGKVIECFPLTVVK